MAVTVAARRAARRRRRIERVHTLNRRLIDALGKVDAELAREVVYTLREVAICRAFLAGRSVPQIEADQALGRDTWTAARIEDAIRRRAKAVTRSIPWR